MEVNENFAKNIVTAFAKISEVRVGIVANNPKWLGGILDTDASDKAAKFIRYCDAYNIPIITLADTPGFVPGLKEEKKGIIRHGAKMLYAYSEATTIRITIILRKEYGGACLAMGCKSMGIDVVYSWPNAEIAVMGAKGAIPIIYKKEIAQSENTEEKIKEVSNEYMEKYVSVNKALEVGFVDDVIEPEKTRECIFKSIQYLKSQRKKSEEKKHGIIPLYEDTLMKERYVITGVGVLLPNTSNEKTLWKNLSEGNSQMEFIERENTDEFKVKVAAEIKDFDYRNYLPGLKEKFAAKYSREILIGMSALENCMKNSGIDRESIPPKSIGIVESTSRSTQSYWANILLNTHSDKELIHGNSLIPGLNGMTASMYAVYRNIQGFVSTLSCACVGGHHAIRVALNELECGNEDIMFVLGTEFPICKPILGLYSDEKTSVMSQEREDPKRAMRPYSANREGFALGEGAVALCIEKLSHAQKRNAKIYCEILGTSAINEAEHATRMDITGRKNAKMLEDLLKQIDRKPDDISYYCAHGTATYYNDLAECRIVKLVNEKECPPIGSIKPIYGHLFGAAAILNVAASALMIEKQVLCPTINVEIPDPECDLDHVTEGKRAQKVDLIISMAHAMGSQSAMCAIGALK